MLRTKYGCGLVDINWVRLHFADIFHHLCDISLTTSKAHGSRSSTVEIGIQICRNWGQS